MFFLNSSCDVSLSGFYVSTCETPAVFHQVKAADSLFCFTLDDVIGVTLTHTHTLFHNLKLFWTRLWRHQSNCSIVSGTQNGCRLKCKWGELSADRSDWHAAFTWGRETFNIIFKYKTDKAQCENSAHHGSVFQCFSVSAFSLSSPLIEQNSLSKSIFSTMFLGFTLSSWLKMKICPSSFSVQPNLFIQTFTCVSARTRTDDRRKLHLHKQLQSGIK